MAKTLRVRVKRTGIERTVNERSYRLAEKYYDLLGEVKEPAVKTVNPGPTPPPPPKPVGPPSNPTGDPDSVSNETLLREEYKAAFGRYPRSDWSDDLIKEKIATKSETV